MNRFSRRTIAFFLLLLVSIVIGALIYFEQIALLYVLATLSLVILMLVVGFSDLEHMADEGPVGFTPKVD